jgi:uncharacterized protein (TIGR03083 family)
VTGTGPDWLDLLRSHTDGFADTVSGAELDAPVTHCPGWSLRDLVLHLGGVHQWAAHAVVEGNPDFRPEIAEAAEAGRPELVAWYRRHASSLVDLLTQTPAGAPAWTMDDQDPTAGFWRRRQVHETVMHTWDAEEALGEPRPIDPWLAWDGVLEVEGIIYPRQVRLGRVEPLTPAVRLVATDEAGDVTLGTDGGEDGAIVVRDRAEVLLRLLWHRADADIERLDARASALLSGAVTP